MPKVILTKAQAAKDLEVKFCRRISDGLAIAKARDYKSNQKLSDAIGVDERVLGRMMDGDFSGRLRIEQLIAVMALAKVYNDASTRDKEGDNVL